MLHPSVGSAAHSAVGSLTELPLYLHRKAGRRGSSQCSCVPLREYTPQCTLNVTASPVGVARQGGGPWKQQQQQRVQSMAGSNWSWQQQTMERGSSRRRGSGSRGLLATAAGSQRQLRVRSSLSSSADEGSFSPQPTSPNTSLLQRVSSFQAAFWKFLRPHTIRGTVLGTTAVVVTALSENPAAIDWALLPRALLGLLALLCGNGFIVGINQIYDQDIDKVNKPFLPVAAGELSAPTASLLCLLLSSVGVAITATHFGTLITALYCLGLLLGTLYSVPPFRLKRFPLPAFLIIATVRGFLLNFGVYHATRAALQLPFSWSPPILFITIFVTLFATVIAITKDLPDIEGDKKFQIETFATKLGVRAIACLGSGLLILNYVGAIAAALYFRNAFRIPLMVPAHVILALALAFQTWKLDQQKYTKESIAAYYRFIWNLFYSEYCLLPFLSA